MSRIICICKYSSVFRNDVEWKKINKKNIYRCYYNKIVQRETYNENKNDSHEIILFPDFEELNEDEKQVLIKLLDHSDCYLVFHNSNKDAQMNILKELNSVFPVERTIIASHTSSGIFGTEMLGKLPSVGSEEEWNQLIEKIIAQFHDKKLEDLIEKVINDENGAKTELDKYISEINSKL